MKKFIISMIFTSMIFSAGCSTSEKSVESDAVNTEATEPAGSDSVKEETSETGASAATKADAKSEGAGNSSDSKPSEAAANSSEHVCTSGENKRVIRVLTKDDGSCEVTYEKVSGTKTLWTANSDLDFW